MVAILLKKTDKTRIYLAGLHGPTYHEPVTTLLLSTGGV